VALWASKRGGCSLVIIGKYLVLADSVVEALKAHLGAKDECFEAFYSPVIGKKALKTGEFPYFSPQPQKTPELS
jgi:hypothetical protein